MSKQKKSVIENIRTYFLIVNLILALFAFAWMVGAQEDGKGEKETATPVPASAGLLTPFEAQKINFGGSYSVEKINVPVYSAEKTISGNYNLLDQQGKVVGTATKEQLISSNLDPDLFSGGFNFNNGLAETIQVGDKTLTGTLLKEEGAFLTNNRELLKQTAEGKWVEAGIPTAPTKPGWGSIFSFQSLTGWKGVVQGALWAIAVYASLKMIGNALGFEPEKVNAAASAAAAGIFAGKTAAGLFGKEGAFAGKLGGFGKFIGAHPVAIGIGVGIAVFILTYKKTTEKLVTFECRSWDAPTGGANCEKCNEGLLPCSEYRCKSLGQACQLLNAGTNEEKCANVYVGDVNSPVIETWKDVLTKEHNYNPDTAIRPPDRGVKVVYQKSSDGCVKAFTPLTFGVLTNEPAQCKIDDTRKNNYEEMTYFFGASNTYKYNHSQTLSLPSPESINAEAPELKADGVYSMYVRCQDANGNSNDDLFVFSFCVEKGPDVTPPRIEGTSIANNMPFQFGLNETDLEVYVNEPADCSWSKVDKDYSTMENSMSCSQHVYEMNNQMLYKCTTTLTDLEDHKDNLFYFRCKDQPLINEADRNIMAQSYKFVLKGTQELNIVDVKPNGTITGYSTLATVNLEVETEAGYNLGDSWCSYTSVENPTEKDYIQMFETGTNLHEQRLDLPKGSYKYYFECVDLGGNSDKAEVKFKVEIDAEAPVVVRVFKDGSKLKLITDEKSTCSFSTNEERECSFDIDEGTNMPYADSTEHSAEWLDGKIYYVKCKDSNERQPAPDECSIIVGAER